MPDTENEPGDRRWRSAETRQALFDHMDEFRQSPQGQQLQAAQQAAEADLQAWLADQPRVVVGRHGGQVPEQWEGEVDGHSFYFRERGGDWDIELDLQKQQASVRRGELIHRHDRGRGLRGEPSGAGGVHRRHHPGPSAA
jgi:hypothetical protein